MSWTGIDSNSDGWTDMYAWDLDGDGDFETVQLDANQDGYVDGLMLDQNNDGLFDTVAVDNNQNGYYEAAVYDTNADGYLDTSVVDNNENGVADSSEGSPMYQEQGVVGGAPTYDGQAGLLLSLASHSGTAVWADSQDSDYDGLIDSADPDPYNRNGG